MAYVVRNGGYNYYTFYSQFLLPTEPVGEKIKDSGSSSKSNNEFLSPHPISTIQPHNLGYKKEISGLVCRNLGFRLSSFITELCAFTTEMCIIELFQSFNLSLFLSVSLYIHIHPHIYMFYFYKMGKLLFIWYTSLFPRNTMYEIMQ